MNKKLSCFIALIITATLLISLPKTMPTAASPATRIYVVPPNIRYTIDNGTVGTLFNVSVWVEDVTDLCGYQVQIRFNQSILDCLDAYEPTWDPNYVLYSILPFTMSTESDKVGQYTIGGSELPGKPQAHFNGTGLITIFKFNITAAPGEGEVLSCLLNINHDQTFLLNSVGATISATKENGYYEFRGRELPPPPPGGAAGDRNG